MNLETAQHIIEQEALLLLLVNPDIKLDVTDGWVLSELFGNNNSEVITEYECFGGEDEGPLVYYVFKIDHPDHDVCYYKVNGHYDSWEDTDWYEACIVIPTKKNLIVWETRQSNHSY